jgi:uncharacterized protein YndB with AHSA1/START domain
VSPERVFDAWLDPEKARRFLFTESHEGPKEVIRAEIDARVGGSFLFVTRSNGAEIDHVGEYLEIDRPRRLVFLFTVPSFWSERTRVAIDIVPRDGGCELTLTHEGLLPEHEDSIFGGWTVFLERLETTEFGSENLTH